MIAWNLSSAISFKSNMFNKIYIKFIYKVFITRFLYVSLIFSSLIFIMNILEELKFFKDQDIGIENEDYHKESDI